MRAIEIMAFRLLVSAIVIGNLLVVAQALPGL